MVKTTTERKKKGEKMKAQTVFLIFSLALISITTVSAQGNLADINQDGEVNWVDWISVAGAAIFEIPVPTADINRDGRIDPEDLLAIQETPGFDLEKELSGHEGALIFLFKNRRLPGDLNGDGVCNLLDTITVSFQYGSKGDDIIEDVNKDGLVDIGDIAEIGKYLGITYFIPDTPLQETIDPEATLMFLREEGNKNLLKVLPAEPQAVTDGRLVTAWGFIKPR